MLPRSHKSLESHKPSPKKWEKWTSDTVQQQQSAITIYFAVVKLKKHPSKSVTSRKYACVYVASSTTRARLRTHKAQEA